MGPAWKHNIHVLRQATAPEKYVDRMVARQTKGRFSNSVIIVMDLEELQLAFE